MAEQSFHKGDHVSWSAHGSRAYGVVQETINERTRIRGRAVDAAPMTRSTGSAVTARAAMWPTARGAAS
ncbi:DUF2945 domain-containing protein [Micromonospora sp. M12]